MQYGFDIILAKNSHEFVQEYLKKPEFAELMQRLGALGDGSDDQSELTIACLTFFSSESALIFFMMGNGCVSTFYDLQVHYRLMNGKWHIYISRLY